MVEFLIWSARLFVLCLLIFLTGFAFVCLWELVVDTFFSWWKDR